MNEVAFINRLNTYNLFNKPNKSQVRGMLAIIDKFESDKSLTDKRWLAYMLATVYHETAKTFEPIEEVGQGIRKPYGRKIKVNLKAYDLPDKLYYGRGFVQLTWYDNYKKFGKLLGIDLLNQPELALKLDISIDILILGMTRGLFTGVGLDKYFNAEKEDWVNARRIINGTDKAELIGLYGKKFYICISS
jgi:predicted chitinase